MSNANFPMQFAQIDLQIRHACFSFMLPQQDIGRDDVEIFVEVSIPKDKKAGYIVWARLLSQDVRAKICEGIAEVENKEKLYQSIVCHLNLSETFYQVLAQFIAHFGKISHEDCPCEQRENGCQNCECDHDCESCDCAGCGDE